MIQARYTNAPQLQAKDFSGIGGSQAMHRSGKLGGMAKNFMTGELMGLMDDEPPQQTSQPTMNDNIMFTSTDNQSPIAPTNVMDRYGPQPQGMGMGERFMRSGNGMLGGVMNYAANQMYGQQEPQLQQQAMGENEYSRRMGNLMNTGGGY